VTKGRARGHPRHCFVSSSPRLRTPEKEEKDLLAPNERGRKVGTSEDASFLQGEGAVGDLENEDLRAGRCKKRGGGRVLQKKKFPGSGS